MSPILILLGLAFVGSVAGLIGGVLFLIKEEWCHPLSVIATPLAAGVLLSLAFLELLPEATGEIGNTAFSVVLAVFVIAFLVERFLFDLHHHDHGEEHKHTSGVSMVIFGDTIHNFLDGVAIGAAFLLNPSLGLLTALSTFLHETPHEIADFGILISNGWSRKKAFMVNLFSALATFPGALLTFFFAGFITGATGFLLAIAAGLFLYVAATDFLPEVGHSHKGSFKQALFLIIGVLVIALLGLFVPEVHG